MRWMQSCPTGMRFTVMKIEGLTSTISTFHKQMHFSKTFLVTLFKNHILVRVAKLHVYEINDSKI